jgi:hypothetical protein
MAKREMLTVIINRKLKETLLSDVSERHDTYGDIRFPRLVLLATNSMVNIRLDATSVLLLPVHRTLLHTSLLCTALSVACRSSHFTHVILDCRRTAAHLTQWRRRMKALSVHTSPQ